MPERPIMYYIFEKQAFQRISNMILRGHKKVKVDEDGRRWMQVGTGYQWLKISVVPEAFLMPCFCHSLFIILDMSESLPHQTAQVSSTPA